MSDYSRSRVSAFHNVELQNVIAMLHLLASLRLRKKSLVRNRFEERAQHFDQTLLFLKNLRLISDSGQILTLTDDSLASLRWPPDEKTTRRIVDVIFTLHTVYRSELCDFLARFQNNGDIVVYSPGTERRVKESAIRNFAIALGLVHFRRRTNDYAIHNSVVDVWMRAQVRRSPKNKRNLMRRRREREELGFAAECAVIEYERKRLGKSFAGRVCHISGEHPMAAYDIESVTLMGDTANPRFIEVKAVSPDLFKFFWSKPEVDVARLLGQSYFLYLVPVRPTRGIDISGLRIVENAYANVYQNHTQWDIESNVVLCQPHRLPVS